MSVLLSSCVHTLQFVSGKTGLDLVKWVSRHLEGIRSEQGKQRLRRIKNEMNRTTEHKSKTLWVVVKTKNSKHNVAHLRMFRVQYASWSVCHGLLGRQGARNGSWFLYVVMNLTNL